MHFWTAPKRATCPAHLNRLDLRFLIMLCEEYNACSSALGNFLHSPVISSLLATHIFISLLFSNTLKFCSSLKVINYFSQSYSKLVGNIIVLYILTFNFLEGRWTEKFCQVNNMHLSYSAFNFFAQAYVICICYPYSPIFGLFHIFKR